MSRSRGPDARPSPSRIDPVYRLLRERGATDKLVMVLREQVHQYRRDRLNQ